MKKLLFAGITAATLSSFSFFNEPLPLGSDIPKADLKMKDIGGSLVSLKEARTPNGLLVMFTCNTCPYVMKNQSRTRDICHYAQDNKLGVILLNSNEGGRRSGDSYADMQAYAKEQGYQWYYAMDSDNALADAFGASRTPECYLFNKDGKLVYHGAIDDSPADIGNVQHTHLKNAISEMLSNTDISV